MENFETTQQPTSSLIITDEIKSFLISTAKWMKFLSILGFVGLGLMAIAGAIMMVVGASFSAFGNMGGGVGAGVIGFIYLVMAALYFFPVLYLFKSGVGLQNGVQSNSQEQLTSGIENLKSHYKFIGILTIVVFSMYILGIIVAIFAIAFMR